MVTMDGPSRYLPQVTRWPARLVLVLSRAFSTDDTSMRRHNNSLRVVAKTV